MSGFPPGVHLKGGQASAESNRKYAREFYAPIIPIVLELRGQGLSLRAIARELNRREISTRTYGPGHWSAVQVKRVLARARGMNDPTGADPRHPSERTPNA